MTSDPERRVAQHRQELLEGLPGNTSSLGWCTTEPFNEIRSVISREKRLKNQSMVPRKLALSRTMNPKLRDLGTNFHC